MSWTCLEYPVGSKQSKVLVMACKRKERGRRKQDNKHLSWVMVEWKTMRDSKGRGKREKYWKFKIKNYSIG